MAANRYSVNAVRDFARFDVDEDVHHVLLIDTKPAQMYLSDDSAQIAEKPDALDIMETDERC